MDPRPDNAVTASPYDTWVSDPTPENLGAAVKDLDPVIRNVLHSIGGSGDPYLYSQARTLTAKAVMSYDPQYGAGLKTWTTRQLQPLRRTKRLSQSAIKIPESIQLDAWQIKKTEQSFMDEHGREPDMDELADAAGLSVKRIQKVQRQFMSTPADAVVTGDGSEDSGGLGQVGSATDFGAEAMDYVYKESDYLDRKILEYKMGYNGKPPLSGNEVAAKLKLTPVQVSRRSAKLGLKIQDYQHILEDYAV